MVQHGRVDVEVRHEVVDGLSGTASTLGTPGYAYIYIHAGNAIHLAFDWWLVSEWHDVRFHVHAGHTIHLAPSIGW